jgi:mono/diheme cytochrome c family protein
MRLFISGVVAAILVLIAGGMALIYTGAYNVAADEDHTALETWILSAAMTNSVKARASSITPPPGYDDEHQIDHGFRLYDEMCVQCHGAPGKKSGEVGLGLRPEPPELSKVVRRWNTAELFWILKHGIKSTGMPAFGKTHTEEQLWNLVAFVQRLPQLTPDQYKAQDKSTAPAHDHDHGSHEHDH